MSIWPGELDYREKMVAVYLNQHKEVVNYETLFMGGRDFGSVDPIVIFQKVLRNDCEMALIAHNHPNNNVDPLLGSRKRHR